MSMERILPKMYKDLLRIATVLWMVWYPHQVVAEESLCHLNLRPQPYYLEEKVENLVWEYPKVPLRWKDQSRKNIWKQFPNQGQKETEKNPLMDLLPWKTNPLRHNGQLEVFFSLGPKVTECVGVHTTV